MVLQRGVGLVHQMEFAMGFQKVMEKEQETPWEN